MRNANAYIYNCIINKMDFPPIEILFSPQTNIINKHVTRAIEYEWDGGSNNLHENELNKCTYKYLPYNFDHHLKLT